MENKRKMKEWVAGAEYVRREEENKERDVKKRKEESGGRILRVDN